jgi:hypothetical protein
MMETRTLELVVEELADLPDAGLIEVLDSQMIFRPSAGQGVRHLNFRRPARSEQYA